MNVLAVGAHPDDLEILCGGTLIRCVERGDHVTMAHLARGDAGSFHHTPDEIASMRHSEAAAAAVRIGATYLSLDISDGRVNSSDERQRTAVVDLVRTALPDLVITHFTGDYMPDHNQGAGKVGGRGR